MPNTGSGRRESYHHIPMPRMTNTYMLNGEDMPEDIIKSVKRGLYAVNFGGGSGRHHQRQIRLLRQRGLPHRRRQRNPPSQGRDPHRQRPRSVEVRLHGRQRPCPRRRNRHLRQVGAKRPGRRRHAHSKARPHDGRGNGTTNGSRTRKDLRVRSQTPPRQRGRRLRTLLEGKDRRRRTWSTTTPNFAAKIATAK